MKKGMGREGIDGLGLRAWDSEKFIDANSPMNERVLCATAACPATL